MKTQVEKTPIKDLTPDPDPAKTQYDLSKCPPSLEEAEHHVRCTRVGKRKDILDMNEEELHAYLRDVCPCCGMYPPSEQIPLTASPKELDNIHLMVGLNARMSNLWMWLMAVCSLLSLYMVIRNILGKQCLTEEEAKDPAKLATNQYLLDEDSVCIKDWITIHSYVNYGYEDDLVGALLYAFLLLVMTAGIKYGMYFSQKHIQEFLQHEHRATDWAVNVIPHPDETPAGIKERIEREAEDAGFKVEVVKVIIPVDLTDFQEVRSEIKHLVEELHAAELEWPGGQSKVEQLNSIILQKRELQAKLLEDCQHQSSKQLGNRFSIVIFKTKEMAHRVYQLHSMEIWSFTGIFKKILASRSSKSKSKVEADPKNKSESKPKTRLIKCNPPEDIIWANLGQKPPKWLMIIFFVMSLAVTFGSPIGLGQLKNAQIEQSNKPSEERTSWRSRIYSVGLSLAIFAVTKTVHALFKFMNKYLKPISKSESVAVMNNAATTFFFILGLVVIPGVFIYFRPLKRDTWINSGPISDLWYLIVLAATLTPFQNVVDVTTLWDWVKKTWSTCQRKQNPKYAVSQQHFNNYLAGSDYDYFKPDADFRILRMATGFVVTILPLAPVVCLIGTFAGQVCHRIKARYFSRQPVSGLVQQWPIWMTEAYVLLTVMYGLMMLRVMIVNDFGYVVFVTILALMALLMFDLGMENLLAKEDLTIPWSRKGYKDVEYTQVQHLLPFCYEREFLPTRDATFAKLEKDVRASPTLSVLQKKALLTRLGIQHNYMKIDHADKRLKIRQNQVSSASTALVIGDAPQPQAKVQETRPQVKVRDVQPQVKEQAVEVHRTPLTTKQQVSAKTQAKPAILTRSVRSPHDEEDWVLAKPV